MSGNRIYYAELKVGLEFQGDEIPDEETLLAPIKEYAKNHLKLYKNTTRIVLMDSSISETVCDEPYEV